MLRITLQKMVGTLLILSIQTQALAGVMDLCAQVLKGHPVVSSFDPHDRSYGLSPEGEIRWTLSHRKPHPLAVELVSEDPKEMEELFRGRRREQFEELVMFVVPV